MMNQQLAMLCNNSTSLRRIQHMPRSRPVRPTLASRFPALRNRLIPLGLGLLGCLLIMGIHAGWWKLSNRAANDFLWTLAATNFLVYAWICTFSGWQLNTQIVVVAAIVAAQAALHQTVRLEGFAGDGRPMWTWKWNPRPQQEFAEQQRRAKQEAKPLAETPVDLATTLPTDYPGFRGADRTGIVMGAPLQADWETHPPRLLWKQPVGAAWSSFAIVGDFAVTQEQRGEHEATVCYELRTGRERWVHEERASFYEVTSGEGPRATPTIYGGRVFSLGATGILNCLDGATGKPIWTIDILKDNNTTNLRFGVTGSPLITANTVIVNPGGRGSSLAAYDLETGKRIWRAGNAGASYSSPQLATLCGQAQVLDFNADGLFAHDLETGTPLWNVPWISNPAERNNVCQPVVLPGFDKEGADCIFLASGYGMGCALLEVQKHNNQFEVTERWRNRNLKAKFSSVVVHEGHVYGLDEAILTCLDLATGKRCWKGGRYNYGQLLLAGSTLLVQLESGEIALVKASPESFQELTRFAALSDRTWNHPALSGPILLVRNDRAAAAFELPGNQE
jgi:outer membrane protein assembly factor BamB